MEKSLKETSQGLRRNKAITVRALYELPARERARHYREWAAEAERRAENTALRHIR
jgi:hypothetical protein